VGDAGFPPRSLLPSPWRRPPKTHLELTAGTNDAALFQVLRFGCVWDRRGEAGVTGDDRLKPYVLRYFLVDDSIQINDAEFERNQRRGLYGTTRPKEAVLVRRQKLPKGKDSDPLPIDSAIR